MQLSRPLAFRLDNVEKVPSKPGVYLLLGTRGIVNYVGSSGRDLRARLRDMLSTGRVPASTFQYQVIQSSKKRNAREQALLDEHAPRYNAA